MKQLILSLGLIVATMISTGNAAEPPASTAAQSEAAQPAAAPAAAKPAAAKPAAGQPTATPAAANPQVLVVTSMGNFNIELNSERAPLTVAQFLKYVDQGYYSGTIFHRAIANFVIQGGGYDVGYKLKGNPVKVVNESGNGLSNQRGSVGLARPPEPHAGDVQFYVNLADNSALDPNQSRWGYAVFGKIVQGMDVVDRISTVPTGAKGPFKEDAPLQPVTIERIERVSTP
jgi:cyclophilin family peptidyl-prolyl cis-trans isomerase